MCELVEHLRQLGLRATAAQLSDVVARATKKCWAAKPVLAEAHGFGRTSGTEVRQWSLGVPVIAHPIPRTRTARKCAASRCKSSTSVV